MDDNHRFSPPVVGGSSLLVIFAVLCFTVFALLSLSSVQTNSRLANATTKAVSDFYQADCQAETILAQLRSGTIPDRVTAAGNVFSFTCPISDTQMLVVDVQLTGKEYTILRWQAESTAQWQPDQNLNLWDGDISLP